MNEQAPTPSFDEAILPHLDAAYNLARWLAGNDPDAQDVVQEAVLRALKFFGGFRGGSSRAWFLTIVRHTFYTWLAKNRPAQICPLGDEEWEAVEDVSVDPDLLSARKADAAVVRGALERLPVEFREILVLREMEECSYKEIASLLGMPIGTVMSRLARARKQLQEILQQAEAGGAI